MKIQTRKKNEQIILPAVILKQPKRFKIDKVKPLRMDAVTKVKGSN